MKRVDVAVLGGGLAGNLLARQLRRHVPDASVAIVERATERAYKVGESTVEIATQYLVRRLGLSTYVYKEHLPKNGLRFFFDREGRDGDLTELSELGVHGLPPYPSFQLDRARLEADLLAMNREAGVDVYLGASVTDLALDGAARAHEITLQGGDAPQALRARWVVDASGRAGLLAKRLDLRVPETEHRVGAAWGRYHGLRDMDDLSTPGASEWRARARHTSRVLSTNHFCYPGYWIWLIPLREGLTSVGVVAEASRWDRRLSRPARAGDDPLATFVRAHRGVGSLLEGAEQVDHGAFGQLSFRTKTFFSGERWGLVGDAAAFPDPFYSPGSDFIAIENDLLTDLIARDLAGEDVQERAQTYDAFMQMRFDTTLALYRGLYPTFGSYELFSAKCYFDTALYYNLLFDAYAADKHLDLRWLRAELRRRASSIATLEGYAERFAAAAREMHRRGTYYRRNLGHYELEGRKAFGVMQAVGEPRSRREVNERSAAVFARTDAMVRAALDDDTTGVPSLDAGGGADAWSRLDA